MNGRRKRHIIKKRQIADVAYRLAVCDCVAADRWPFHDRQCAKIKIYVKLAGTAAALISQGDNYTRPSLRPELVR